MLKKISAALLVASMLAAPAMAAEAGKTADKAAIKTETAAPAIKPVAATETKQVKPPAVADSKLQVKPAVRNASARMGRHHHRHFRAHHRFHKRFGMHHGHKHIAFKSTVAHIKRG
jgi:hypothetical protein